MPLTADELRDVDEYVSSWWTAVLSGEAHPAPSVPLIQKAALEHPNGKTRRLALGLLDHHANDESTDTFRLALRDPAPVVRMNALHGLACERCRVGELCVDDVVPSLIEVLEHDPSPKVRYAALVPLYPLASRDARVHDAFARAAVNDGDPVVRAGATAARDGHPKRISSYKAAKRKLG
jgi:hypothetical protein